MGKGNRHAHKFILITNSQTGAKMWRCAFPECRWFVHAGLAHLIPGKHATCWDCNEIFVIDEMAMKEEMPRCIDCRLMKPIETRAPEPINETQKDEIEVINEDGTEKSGDRVIRTPSEEIAYDKLMTELWGKNWKQIREQRIREEEEDKK